MLRRAQGTQADMGWLGWSYRNVERALYVDLNKEASVNCLARGLLMGN